MKRILLAVCVLAVSLRAGDEVRRIEIATSRGSKLDANLHLPAKPNGAAVVLAAGRGYHALTVWAKRRLKGESTAVK